MSQSKLLAEYESMLQLTTGQTLSPLETSEQVLEALGDGSTVVLSLSDGGEDALLTAERVLDDRILFVNPRKTQGARPGQELPAAGPLPPRRAEPGRVFGPRLVRSRGGRRRAVGGSLDCGVTAKRRPVVQGASAASWNTVRMPFRQLTISVVPSPVTSPVSKRSKLLEGKPVTVVLRFGWS